MNSRRNSKPVLVDESLGRAFAVKYTVYSIFGLVGVFVYSPSVSLFAGDLVAALLGAIICISGAASAVSAWNSITPRWMKREYYSTIVLMSFVATFVVTLIVAAASGYPQRIPVAVISTGLLVMPAWRIRYIIRTLRA